MLYLIGLGLGDERDITVKGLEIVKRCVVSFFCSFAHPAEVDWLMKQSGCRCNSCDKVFLEAYTSVLGVDRNRLEAFYGREVLEADRDLVEQGADAILQPAKTSDVAFLVVGDVFGYVCFVLVRFHARFV